MNNTPRIGMSTPWGLADYVEELAVGITVVGTPSHGGIHLSRERLKEMPKHLRKGQSAYTPPDWFEEDCEVAYVLLSFPELFPKLQESALATLKNYFPNAYEKESKRKI